MRESERGTMLIESTISLTICMLILSFYLNISANMIHKVSSMKALQEITAAILEAKLHSMVRQCKVTILLAKAGYIWCEGDLLQVYHWSDTYKFDSNFPGNRITFSKNGISRGGSIYLYLNHNYAGKLVINVSTANINIIPAHIQL